MSHDYNMTHIIFPKRQYSGKHAIIAWLNKSIDDDEFTINQTGIKWHLKPQESSFGLIQDFGG